MGLTYGCVEDHDGQVWLDGVSDGDHLLKQLGLLLVSPGRIHDDDVESLCAGSRTRRGNGELERSSFFLRRSPRPPPNGLTLFELLDTLSCDDDRVCLCVGPKEWDLCLCRVLLELVERSGPERVGADETRLESPARVVDSELGARRRLSSPLDTDGHEHV